MPQWGIRRRRKQGGGPVSKALCGAKATAERYCELRRTKKTAPSGITGNTTYDNYSNILTKAAPGRTVGSSYNWGSTEAEKKKHFLQSVTLPLGTRTSFQYDAYGN